MDGQRAYNDADYRRELEYHLNQVEAIRRKLRESEKAERIDYSRYEPSA